MSASASHSLLLPSLVRTSSTEEALPPYLAGITPLISWASRMALLLKTEKAPSKWAALYTGTPSSSTRF